MNRLPFKPSRTTSAIIAAVVLSTPGVSIAQTPPEVNAISFGYDYMNNELNVMTTVNGVVQPTITLPNIASIQNVTNAISDLTGQLSQYLSIGGSGEPALIGSNASENSVALGISANALSAQSTAIGATAVATGGSAVAIGSQSLAFGPSSTAVGFHAQAMNNNSVALGQNSVANQDSTVSVGSNVAGSSFRRRITNLADGDAVSDAATVGQMNGAINTAEQYSENELALTQTSITTAAGTAAVSALNTAVGQYLSIGAADGGSVIGTPTAIDAIALGDGAAARATNSIAVGTSAQTNQGGDIAIGAYATANGASVNGSASGTAISIGVNSQATAVDASALGSSATASAQASVAIGSTAQATGENSASLGDAAEATYEQTTAIGATAHATLESDSAFGFGAHATGDASTTTPGLATAIGSFSRATADGATALGYHAQATATNSVALGQGSIADLPDTVSVGADGSTGINFTRVITNVKAGHIAQNSTDAVNGSQLYATNQSVVSALGGTASVNADGTITGPTYSLAHADAINDSASASSNTTVGAAFKTVDTALGNLSSNITAETSRAETQEDALQKSVDGISGQVSNAVVYDSTSNSVTFGGTAAPAPVTLHNVAAGTLDTDAANAGQVNAAHDDAISTAKGYTDGEITKAEGIASGAVATETTRAEKAESQTLTDANAYTDTQIDSAVLKATGDLDTTLGRYVSIGDANGDAVIGSNVGANSMAIGYGATATGMNSVAIGAGAVAEGSNVFSVGSTQQTRTITNVHAGAITATSTDAVNGSQLYNVQTQVTANTNAITALTNSTSDNAAAVLAAQQAADNAGTAAKGAQATADQAQSTATAAVAATTAETTRATAAEASLGDQITQGNAATLSSAKSYTDQQSAITLGQANSYTDQRVDQLQSAFDSFRQDTFAGIASALAVAGLPQPTAPGRSMVSVAGSTYHGQTGFAAGYSLVSGNENWVFKGSVTTNSRGDFGAVVSAGRQF